MCLRNLNFTCARYFYFNYIRAYAIYAASVAVESSVREPRDHHVVAVLLLDEPSFSAFAVT